MIRRIIGLALLLILVMSLLGCLHTMDVTGEWIAYVTWESEDSFSGSTTTITLDLSQDRSALTGSVTIDAAFMHVEMNIDEGSGRNDYISIDSADVVEGSYTAHAMFLHLEGHVSGRNMSGSGTLTIDGKEHGFTWAGQRSASS